MLRRDMSSSPPLGDSLPKRNKFVGEMFGVGNSRTIFAGAPEDRLRRDSRVLLLLGPKSAGKSGLVDFFCSHVYGATIDGQNRYHIANEKFDGSTPDKSIITYVFNDSEMKFRPIVVDTPGPMDERDDISPLLKGWMDESSRMRVDVVAVVIPSSVRMTSYEEEQLTKSLSLLPSHVRSRTVVILTGSDGSAPQQGLLRRFDLQDCPLFKVNASCLFQKTHNDALQEHLRTTYWRMTEANLSELMLMLRSSKPVTFSGQMHDKFHFPGSVKSSSDNSSVNGTDASRGDNSSEFATTHSVAKDSYKNTVAYREPTIERIVETQTTSRNGEGTTTTSMVTSRKNTSRTEETSILHPPAIRVLSTPDLNNGSAPSIATGLPSSLLEDIRKSSLRRTSNHGYDPSDDVVVVEYAESRPEVVLVHNSPQPPIDTRASRDQLYRPYDTVVSSRYDLPPAMPPLPVTRPYDLPPTSTVTAQPAKVVPYEVIPIIEKSPAPRPNEDRTRVYSMETTPPPFNTRPQTTNGSSTYSTVAYMNEDGTSTHDTLKAYTPSTKTELTSSKRESAYGTLSSQLRHPQQEAGHKYATLPARTVPVVFDTRHTIPLATDVRHSAPIGAGATDRPSPQSSDELAILARSQSTRTARTASPIGDVPIVRYVYDIGSRSHKSHTVGSRNSMAFEEKKRQSRSLEPRSSHYGHVGDDGFYSGEGVIVSRNRSPQRKSTNSLHRLSYLDQAPELVHSEDNYAYIDPSTKTANSQKTSPQKETVIDFPAQTFDRNDTARRSRHYGSPTEEKGAPIPARRTSLGRKSKDRRSALLDVDMRDNPEYSIGGGAIVERPTRISQHEDEVNRLMREREDMLRRTREDVNRDSYPSPRRPQYENIGQGVTPQQPRESGNRNDVMIPPEMRGSKSPITVRVDMVEKQKRAQEQQPPLPPHGYRDTDYGDDWDEEGSGTRPPMTQQQQVIETRGRVDNQLQRQSRPADIMIGDGARNGNGAHLNQGNDPRSPAPPPYPYRPYPGTPRDAGDSDVEQGAVKGSERRPLQPQRGGRTKGGMRTGRGLTTVTTTTTTKSTVRKKKSLMRWSPSNCSNPRDCCLNILCFVVAPLFILAVIVTIVVIILTSK